ncbi:MAG TPA: META domain-containing protein [Woeseiaceae bacterium]|nr:META domain-containing protein [Woeseiaceae bacterium]
MRASSSWYLGVGLVPLMLCCACTPGTGQHSKVAAIPEEKVAAPAPATDELSGSAWQLVRIQSMDDSVYTPDERRHYTLEFGTDGSIAVRADCNRGRGTWNAESANQLLIGPLALTRAMCGPGSLHDRFVADLGFVRSYILQDGMLHLATMADGAILDFEPAALEPQ